MFNIYCVCMCSVPFELHDDNYVLRRMGLHRMNANPGRDCPPPFAGTPSEHSDFVGPPSGWDEGGVGGGSGVKVEDGAGDGEAAGAHEFAPLSQASLADPKGKQAMEQDVKPFRCSNNNDNAPMSIDVNTYNLAASTS